METVPQDQCVHDRAFIYAGYHSLITEIFMYDRELTLIELNELAMAMNNCHIVNV